MLQFISLGSGSCGNCYYINSDGYGIIIDLGIGIRSFKKLFSDYGLKIAQIQAALITHDHTDHVKAIGSLSRDFHIPVYTSQKVHDSIMHNHYVSKKIPLPLQHSITRGQSFQLGLSTLRRLVCHTIALIIMVTCCVWKGNASFCLQTWGISQKRCPPLFSKPHIS